VSVASELSAACAALTKARAALAAEIATQGQAVEAAEFGPHGSADRIQAETERLDGLRGLDEQLESSLEDLTQAASDVGDLL